MPVKLITKDQSRPRFPKNSKHLTINKHGNIALFKIFSFQIQKICILETILPHYTTKLLKLWAFWVICANKPYVYWLLIKPPLLNCTRESDPDAG